jgi:hypothetical protein
MGAHDPIPPGPAISRHESPSEVRQRTCHCNQINENMHQTDLRLSVREILGRPPLFDPSQQPPRHQPGVKEKMILPVTETARPCQDQARSRRRNRRPRLDPSQGPLQPPPAMAAARPCRRGNPWIRASAPPPQHLLLHMQPTVLVRHHEITASPHRRCMPFFALYRLARRTPSPPSTTAAA